MWIWKRKQSRVRKKRYPVLVLFVSVVGISVWTQLCVWSRWMPKSIPESSDSRPWQERTVDSSTALRFPIRDGIPLFDPQTCRDPMSDWQTFSFLNCNRLHEVDLTSDTDVNLLGVGGQRIVYLYQEHTVFKTMRWKNSHFSPSQYEHVRIDSLLSERLTASPHVMNVHGHCGLSTLHQVGVYRRGWQRMARTSLEKYHLARQLSRALADLHEIGDGGGGDDTTTAAVVWRNLKAPNVLFVGNVLKINDFDDSILIPRNRTLGKPCTFTLPTAAYRNRTFQPPELCYSGKALTPAIDLYALGSLLYEIMTHRVPYEEYRESNPDEIHRRKQAGILPSMMHVSADLEILQKMVQECMALDPTQRPTARQVALELDRAYQDLTTRSR